MSSVFLYFFRSDLVRNQLFRLRIAVKAICFSSLVNKPLGVLTMSLPVAASFPTFPINYAMDQSRFQSNIPSNQWHIAGIFQIC